MKQPSTKELDLLRLAEHDLISDTELGRRLGCTRQNAAGRMWRVHLWQVRQKRLRRAKP